MILLTILCAIAFSGFLLMAVLGAKNNQASLKSSEGYFFGNRNLNSILLAGTLLATQVGGGMLIGISDASFTQGLAGFFYPLGQIIGLVLVYALLAKKFAKLNLQTAPEVFSKIYQSNNARTFASWVQVASLSIILIAQAVAIKKLLLAMGVSNNFWLVLIWSGVIFYTSIGGFLTVVKTDLIQIGLIAVGLGLILYFVPNGSFEQILQSNLMANGGQAKSTALLGTIIWPCAYLLCEQDMLQRFVAAKNSKFVKSAILLTIAGLITLASVPVLIGILASSNIVVTDGSSVLIKYMQASMPSYVVSIGIFVLLMAIISTIDSILCAISSLIACDKLILSQSNYKTNLIITVTVGIFALIGALYCSSVLNTLVFAYGLAASSMSVPFVMAVLKGKNLPKSQGIGAMLGGVISFVGLYIFWQDHSWLALLGSLIGSGIGFYSANFFKK